ncbi:NAD-dependent epimerase/dehydratase family protein [Selenomonas montiformis]|uniref:NAD(P)-dependent oxidoreductase n=1 Tax=Selenomonas montiformis TaxID=2652285 RepID=A0A6I2UXA6_9FIRM|nr:NAD-dependent epimerase/dehydratase family protein [Selenomonas montiformis]MSV24704.1 NAD(P)-dependent oxidoreductase [Selenomonas montiformis]SDG15979.1 Nucleoside-diphosphate-sugar epimerase [Selenomonas ruminantium]
MKHAIVTGANGFVGSAVVRELVANGVRVTAICHNGNKTNIIDDPLVKVYSAELDNIAALKGILPDSDYDVFFHFAWNGSAGAARADTTLQLKNAEWTVDALRVAKVLGCKRFVGSGSIMEHETMAAAFTQGNQPGLGYIYGAGKLVSHIMCMSMAAKLGIELVWPEITNAYGVGEVSPRMVNTTIRKCINGENPQFTAGTQNYDFVYIDDVARAFYLIAENGKSFHEYLIGSSTARPLKEFLIEMKNAIAPQLEFIFGDVPFTGIDMPLSKFDCSETERDTGFRAQISFAEGTRKTMEWLKSREN